MRTVTPTPQGLSVSSETQPAAGSRAARASHDLAYLSSQGNKAATVNELVSGAGQDELIINLRLARAPANELHLSTLGAADNTHMTTTSLALGPEASHVSTDRLGVLFNQASLGGHEGLSGQAGTTMGLLFGSVTEHVGSMAIQGYAGGIGQTSVIGASVTKTIGGVGIVGGASLVVSGDTRLRVHTFHDNRYQLEYKDIIQTSGQMIGGVSSGHLGLGIRLGASRVRDVVYRSWVSPKDAEKLMQGRSRLKDKLSMLRLRKPLLPIPAISDPLNVVSGSKKNVAQMKIGDEIYVTYTGTLLGGISATGGGIYLGAHVSLAGTHQLEIKKISAYEMEVSAVPSQKSQAVGFGIDLPIVAEGHLILSRSHATRHTYVFDLREDEAAQAYQKAVDGELPGPLYEVDKYTVLGASQASQAIVDAVMPKGVVYQQLEQAAVSFESVAGAGITLPGMVPYANLAGIGVERRFRKQESVTSTRNAAIYESSTRKETEIQSLHRGSREVASYGSVQTIYTSDAGTASLGGVTVGVAFSTDRTQRNTRNKILQQLQTHGLLNADVGTFADDAQKTKYDYQVVLERVVTKGTLAQTAPDGASAQEHADQLREQVTQQGAAGLASLAARFENTNNALQVSVHSTGPTILSQKIIDLSATYQKPIEPARDKTSATARRIKDVHKYLERIATLRRDIAADPILSKLDAIGQQAQLASLDTSEQALRRLVRFDHLDSNNKAYLISRSSRQVRSILNAWKKKGML